MREECNIRTINACTYALNQCKSTLASQQKIIPLLNTQDRVNVHTWHTKYLATFISWYTMERKATKHWKVMAMQCMYYTLEEKHTRKRWARVWVSECHRTIERYLHTQYRKKIKPNPIRLNSKEKTEETKTECHSPNGISQSKQVAAKHPADAPLILSSSKCGAYFLKHTATPTW